MIENIIELNPEGNQVELVGLGVQTSYPCKTQYKEQITQWLEGRTDEWDAQKEAYDNYQAILAYEACITGVIPEEGCGIKPHGWYSQEEVDASQAAWNKWNTCELANPGECGREPIILKRPADLPVVAEPPVLVPNTIEPYDEFYGWTVEDHKNAKFAELKAARDEQVNGVVNLTTSLNNTYPVDCNITNRSNMHQVYDNSVVAGVDPTTLTNWKMGDNQYYQISYAELAELGPQLSVYIGSTFQHEADKIQEVIVCGDDVACIKGVIW